MLAALTYGLVLFLVVAIAIGTRAWLLEQLSIFAPLPPSAAGPGTSDPQRVERTDNVITITDWQEAQARRRARQEAVSRASGA